jgi:hypothetical protein
MLITIVPAAPPRVIPAAGLEVRDKIVVGALALERTCILAVYPVRLITVEFASL